MLIKSGLWTSTFFIGEVKISISLLSDVMLEPEPESESESELDIVIVFGFLLLLLLFEDDD